MDLHVRVCWFGVRYARWGYVGHVPATTYQSLTLVPLDTFVCNVEGCGLIADVLNPLIK